MYVCWQIKLIGCFIFQFEYDVTFRSHKAVSTLEGFENVLKTVYHYTLRGVYNFVVCITGLFLVLFWATVNGLTIYYQSWCLSPITRFSVVCLQGACHPTYEITQYITRCINQLCGILLHGSCIKSRMQQL